MPSLALYRRPYLRLAEGHLGPGRRPLTPSRPLERPCAAGIIAIHCEQAGEPPIRCRKLRVAVGQQTRPYQGIPHSDLRRLIRQYEKRIKESERQQSLIGWSNISDPEWQIQQNNIDGDNRHISDIEEELNHRRLRQIEREQAEERRLQQPVPTYLRAGAGQRATQDALNEWFNLHFKSRPHRINLSWYIDDRQFMAWFMPKTGALEVALVVAKDTPGSFQRGGKSLLPADTLEEMSIALASPAPPSQGNKRQ